jgi:hypothetical protein
MSPTGPASLVLPTPGMLGPCSRARLAALCGVDHLATRRSLACARLRAAPARALPPPKRPSSGQAALLAS